MIRLTVVGDALLDRDLVGVVDRFCPDTPAPVVEHTSVFERPGGAALAAVLAARRGVDVTLLAPIADDPAGRRLIALLGNAGVSVVPWRDPAPTIEKERVMVGNRTLVRLDRGGGERELPEPPPDGLSQLRASDSVLVADYGRGTSGSAAARAMITDAAAHGVPVVWDPHRNGARPVPRITLATPNTKEVLYFDQQLDGTHTPDDSDLSGVIAAAHRLLGRWQATGVCVTRGADGAALVTDHSLPFVVPVDSPDPRPLDACGAGDAFAAACAVAFADGALMSEAVQAGVGEATHFVSAGGAFGLVAGAHPVSHALRPTSAGATVVATGGCFDLLHAGHVAMLQRARQLGDRLVVLLNGDASVTRLKGEGRPLQTQADRAAVLRSLGCVDDVIVFDEDTPIEALRALRPQVFVKGGDYSSTDLPEASVLAEWHGVVITVPYLAGRSTTGIVEQIEAGHHIGATRVG